MAGPAASERDRFDPRIQTRNVSGKQQGETPYGVVNMIGQVLKRGGHVIFPSLNLKVGSDGCTPIDPTKPMEEQPLD